MNILFLVFHGFSEFSGVSKKIYSQVKGLKENGHNVLLCCFTVSEDKHRILLVNDEVIADYGKGIYSKIKKRICFSSLLDYIKKSNIDFIYIRSYHNSNPFLVRFISKLKNLDNKIVMEIPTYPYDKEYMNAPIKKKLEHFVDMCFRNRLAKNLNSIVTFSGEKQIFGCKTINISNGVDFDGIKPKSVVNNTSNALHLIGVAEVHFWHGFDRLIKGLATYYSIPRIYQVFFHIVGEPGPDEKKQFDSLVQLNNLDNYVLFHGQLFDQELDNLFILSDFGIGSLGRHRSNITRIKTLKNREYAARGIPFIYSEIDDDFEDMPYIMKAPADESPINIEEIISFYSHSVKDPYEIRNSIIYLSWKNQMQKVITEVFNLNT